MASDRPRARLGEHGVNSLEAAFVVPVVLAVILVGLHAGLVSAARTAAQTAAAACAETARGVEASAGAGQSAAEQILASSAFLTGWTVTAERGSTQTVCTVTGTARTLLPSAGHVTRTVAMPTERVTRP